MERLEVFFFEDKKTGERYNRCSAVHKIIFPPRGFTGLGPWTCEVIRDTKPENPRRGALIIRPLYPGHWEVKSTWQWVEPVAMEKNGKDLPIPEEVQQLLNGELAEWGKDSAVKTWAQSVKKSSNPIVLPVGVETFWNQNAGTVCFKRQGAKRTAEYRLSGLSTALGELRVSADHLAPEIDPIEEIEKWATIEKYDEGSVTCWVFGIQLKIDMTKYHTAMARRWEENRETWEKEVGLLEVILSLTADQVQELGPETRACVSLEGGDDAYHDGLQSDYEIHYTASVFRYRLPPAVAEAMKKRMALLGWQWGSLDGLSQDGAYESRNDKNKEQLVRRLLDGFRKRHEEITTNRAWVTYHK